MQEGDRTKARRSHFTTPAGARYFLKNVSTDDLLKMKRTPGVYLELLFRKGVRDEYRREALAGLAKLENKQRAARCWSTRSATRTSSRTARTRASSSTWCGC